MHLYDRSRTHDLLVAQWWERLASSGELRSLFAGSCDAPSAFYAMFAPPKALLFDADERGISIAMWFEPVMSGALTSLWIRPDRRQSPGVYRELQKMYEVALERWPVLVGITRQERLLEAHRRLGYVVVGTVPHIWDGNDAWVLALTKEGWTMRRAH